MCALQILIYIIPITTLGGRYSGHIESMQKLCNFPSVMQVARSSWAQDRRASPAAPVLLTKNGPPGLRIPCNRSCCIYLISKYFTGFPSDSEES